MPKYLSRALCAIPECFRSDAVALVLPNYNTNTADAAITRQHQMRLRNYTVCWIQT